MTVFKGKWVSDYGHKIWFISFPFFKNYVLYKPKKGRFRILPTYHYVDYHCKLIGLHFLGLMEAMFYLWPASDIETKEVILIPMIEEGPETLWELDDYGFPWVFPLSVFRKNQPK